MERRQRLDRELWDMAREHIVWELNTLMFDYSDVRSSNGQVSWKQAAPFAAALLHLRNLSDFLCPTKSAYQSDDDVLAVGYTPAWQPAWKSQHPMRPPDRDGPFDNLRFIMNKYLSHITWQRVKL